MAYSPTGFQLTHLLQDAWYRLGQFKRWKATDGSLTSIENTLWAGVEEQIFEDDDPSLIYGTAVILRRADGLGTAPEGEMVMITDYDSASTLLFTDPMADAPVAGDAFGIATPLFPLDDMIELANIAIQRLGEIDIPDTTLSVVANQTEYLLPAYIKERPTAVFRQTAQVSGNNQWVPVQGWNVIPAAVGTQWTLVLPTLPTNYALRIMYRTVHPRLTSYDSDILDIHPELAVCALVAEALQWYNNLIGGTNQYFMQRENKALQDLESALVRHPIRKTVEQVQGMIHWGHRGEYVPGTSDLRG